VIFFQKICDLVTGGKRKMAKKALNESVSTTKATVEKKQQFNFY